MTTEPWQWHVVNFADNFFFENVFFKRIYFETFHRNILKNVFFIFFKFKRRSIGTPKCNAIFTGAI
jgi:hypothetical protein